MRQIYEMFHGSFAPEQLLAAAGGSTEAQFYAHLYLGLYFEALGKPEGAREHIRKAASDRYKVGGYMHDVARVHRNVIDR